MRDFITIVNESLLLERFKPAPAVFTLSDGERLNWIHFIIEWINGKYMGAVEDQHVERWAQFAKLFPHGLVSPTPLYRVMTVPFEYADLSTFHISRPAPGPVGSWTSTKVGMDTVAGVASEFSSDDDTTARIGVSALIEPQNIFASYKSLRHGFLSLLHDFEYEDETWVEGEDGVSRAKWPMYLGDDSETLHSDLGYMWALFRDVPGGPYRQSEHIVKTTPVEAKLVYTYRYKDKTKRLGMDDPHNW